MLRKKLESFLLILSLFLFSCTIEENKKVTREPETSEYKVSIEIVNVEAIEKSTFTFEGTIDGNPIYIPEDSVGIGKSAVTLGSGGKLNIKVRAYSLKNNEMVAFGEAEKAISGNTSFEIELKSVSDDELFYLTFDDEGIETKTSYYKNENVGELPYPTKDGHTFQGWYTLPNGEGIKLNSNYSMTSNLTVYAYWVLNNPDITVTCTFDTKGGSNVSPQTVAVNRTINKPEQPTRSGYAFTGWYSDAACTVIVNFPYTVTKDITLYAGWVPEASVVKVTGVKLTQTSLVFDSVGKTLSLVPVIEPTTATNKSVSWVSSDPSVVSVDNQGEVISLKSGTATITVTTEDGGFTATCSVTVNGGAQVVAVTGVSLSDAAKTINKGETFILTATVQPENATNKNVKWTTSNSSVVSVSSGKVTALAAGTAIVTATTEEGAHTANCNVTVTDPMSGKTIIFVKATSAPNIWVWEVGGVEISKVMRFTWEAQDSMKAVEAGYMNNSTGWFMYDISDYATGKPISFILNKDGNIDTEKKATFWYDGTSFYDEDPTTPVIIIPAKPTVTISPASGSISLSGSIKVTFTDGNDTITSAKVSINGTQYDMGITAGTFTKSVKDLGITAGGTTITVSTTVTNGEGSGTANATLTTTDTPVVEDTFTWDNALVYFVLTDRFYNGNTANDHSYNRNHGSAPDVASFHGGDIAGLTQKLDYLEKLGVNAIWITAPYEQAHGWTDGKDGQFPHYAFHGYYTLDWTFLDQNMGTIEEFRTFVNTAHEKGIRIVMDVVMNHTGYFTMQDAKTYNCGEFKNNKTPPDGWCPSSNWKQWDNSEYALTDGAKWGNFWGKWVRAFGGQYGFSPEFGSPDSDPIRGSLSGLPDVVTEMTEKVTIPAHLKTKWGNELSSNKNWVNPSVANVDWGGMSGNWRDDNKGAPADYIVAWLSAWVREFGIDGFRCDTAKHVHMYRWGQLKAACEDALKKWRADPTKVDTAGAKDWDENFWMTGECFGWASTAGQGDYYTTGGFDSMINFSFNGTSGSTGRSPTTSDWGSYININNNDDSDNNGNRNNVLSYVSSHDTGLHRATPTNELGTKLVLLPGGVQIYYGDESGRPEINGYGDADMKTRGDMNWTTPTHWNKVGTFRKFNPAVGAGKGSAMKRTYSGTAGESKVAIGVNGTSVDVSGLFDNGTTVYNWYDGKSAQVLNGKVTFEGGNMSQPILVSDKNPADFGVTF